MITAVTAGGAQVSIVAKHVTSVMEVLPGRLDITLVGGNTITIQADYVGYVAELAKLI